MAQVRFGGGVSEIRGSIAGNVFSRNRSGAIIRNRINPINPNTQSQADIRYLFSLIASRWSLLTQTQRDQWDEYAGLISKPVNKLGEPYTPSGRQVFQQCNSNRVLANSTLNASPPIGYTWDISQLINVPDFSEVNRPLPPEFNFGVKDFSLTLAGGVVDDLSSDNSLVPPSAGTTYQMFAVEATPVMDVSVRNRKNRFRFLGALSAAAANPLDLTTEYKILFPQSGLVAGQSAIIRLWTVNLAGLASDKIEVTATAT